MPESVYIASAEPRSGKTLVTLGVMQLLSAQGRHTSLFRPVVRSSREPDPLTSLITQRYGLTTSYESMFGCTAEVARRLVSAGAYDELLQTILGKFRALEQGCDSVVCVGSDYTGIEGPFELDFNADLARNLGTPVLALANGHDRAVTELVDRVQMLRRALESHGCMLTALMVNRVDPSRLDELQSRLAEVRTDDVPVYVLPEHRLLGLPSVGEIAQALGASWVTGERDAFDREVSGYKAVAMTLPHFLDRLQRGDLILTPGDRADIILGTLLSDASSGYPPAAGMVLTGGLAPPQQVLRLMDGLSSITMPVMHVETDTYETAMQVSAVTGGLQAGAHRKIAVGLGLLEKHVDRHELIERIVTSRPARTTPLMFNFDLVERAKSDRRHIVLPEGTDERVLRAAETLLLRGVVDLTLLGNIDTIDKQINTLGLHLESIRIIDPLGSPLRQAYAQLYHGLREHKGISEEMAFDAMGDPSYFGTMMVHCGDADGMVSGAVNTTQQTIRPALEIIKTAPGCPLVSSVFFMCLEDRVLVYGDCAVNPDPDAEQLAHIAISSAETASRFGIEARVAMLSYSTGDSGKGSGVDKVREATRIARELRPTLKLEGPIQYDAAVDAGVARSKLPGSEVAGQATVLIFPDLNAGNSAYKAVQRSARAIAIGPVLQGLNRPVNDLSRGCTIADVFNTVAITAIQAQGGTAETP